MVVGSSPTRPTIKINEKAQTHPLSFVASGAHADMRVTMVADPDAMVRRTAAARAVEVALAGVGLQVGEKALEVGDRAVSAHTRWTSTRAAAAVAVGARIAPRPPHSSVRAALPHTAPALSHAAKRSLGYG